MPVETATYINTLDATNPLATDPKNQGDDHLRLIKSAVKATFPNFSGPANATHIEVSYLVGVTSAIQTQLNARATLTGTETLTNKSLTSPALTGTPTAPTATAGTNTTQVATTAFVAAAFGGGGSMVYPGAGIPVSTGSAWGTSKTTPAGTIVGTTDTQTLTNKTLTAPAFGNSTPTGIKVVGFNAEYDNGNSGTTKTVTLANGQKQKLTLTGNLTLTVDFGSASVGTYQIRLIQDATGSRTLAAISGLSGSRWLGAASQPSHNTAANGETILNIYYDGTSAVQSMVKVGAI